MYVTEHVAVPAVAPAARVQLGAGVKVPVELVVKSTVPVGVVAPLAEVSVTVAVHDEDWLTCTLPGLHVMLVVVGWACDTIGTAKFKS